VSILNSSLFMNFDDTHLIFCISFSAMISIVITVKNGDLYLKEAFEGLLAQTYRNFEVLTSFSFMYSMFSFLGLYLQRWIYR
jgi:hypothetical protein